MQHLTVCEHWCSRSIVWGFMSSGTWYRVVEWLPNFQRHCFLPKLRILLIQRRGVVSQRSESLFNSSL